MRLEIFTGFFLSVLFFSFPVFASQSTSVPADTKIILKRGACYGACPEYTLVIYGDGKVIYGGKDFVSMKGHFEKHMAVEKVANLVNGFEQINFLSNDFMKCSSSSTDPPVVTITFTMNGVSKSVVDDYGCIEKLPFRKELRNLEDSIDRMADTAQWIKSQTKL